MFAEDSTGPSHRHIDCTTVADTTMVSSGTTNVVQPALDSTSLRNITRCSNKSATTPPSQETPPIGVSCLRRSFERYNLSTEVADFIMESWRKGTKKQYSTYINQWVEFCSQRQISHNSPEMKDTLQFLMMLVNKGLSYSTVNTARSALSNIITERECVNFGTHLVVTRFMKACSKVYHNMGCIYSIEVPGYIVPQQ